MAMNSPHTIAVSFPLINCNSRNCLQNMFPLSTVWFSKWSHSSIVLKLGLLRCSKHSKCWGISTQHITSVKITPIPTFPWPINKYSDTPVFPRFFRGSSFLESHCLILSQESLHFYQLMAESFGQTFPLLLAEEKGTDPKIAERTSKPAGEIAWPILSFY